MLKVREGDRVKVLTGKDAGKEGRVIRVHPSRNLVLVEGVNRVKRHEKVRPAKGRSGQEGGITSKELPVNISNVSLLCRNDGVARVGFRIGENGVKVRVCKKCGIDL